MKLKVILQNKTLVDMDADYIHFISENGEAGMLDNHAPIILLGKKGFLRIKKEQKEKYVAYLNGILKVANNEAVLLASMGVVSDIKEKASEELTFLYDEYLSRNKQENVDFSKLEKELFDNLKKGKAGSL